MRAFVALPLPHDIRLQLSMVQQMLPLTGRVLPENFHITLAFLDDQPAPVLETLHDALTGLSAPTLSLSVAGIAAFGGDAPRLIHAEIAPDDALSHLQAAVTRAAVAAGIALKRRRFHPHVTLSRDRPRGADLARLTQALADLTGFCAGPFEVTEMGLYSSTLGPKGPRYDPLARYSLSGRR